MVLEKKLVDSVLVEVEYHSEQWHKLLGNCPMFGDELVDIIQMCKHSDNYWLVELITMDIQTTEVAIPFDGNKKNDWQKLDITKPIQVKSKIGQPLMQKSIIPQGTKYPYVAEIPLDQICFKGESKNDRKRLCK